MRLKCKNVERIVDSEAKAKKLEAAGFVVCDDGKGVTREETKEVKEMTLSELRNLAKEKGIEGAGSLTKAELLSVLKG